MTKKEAVDYFGSVTALCDALGISRSTYYRWDASIPHGRQSDLERMTRGKLKSDHNVRLSLVTRDSCCSPYR